MNTQVEILVNGKPVKQYCHQGNTYVEARNNTEYTIKVKNNSGVRKLAVITVDGVNVISGKPQDEGVGQGYIIGGYDSLDVKGYRKDLETVGAFKFCQKGRSYCNEVGAKGNNGVIGVRVYDEDVASRLNQVLRNLNVPKWEPTYPSHKPTWTSPDIITGVDKRLFKDRSMTCSSNEATYSAEVKCSASAPNFDMGSTWGNKIVDKVVTVDFKPSITFEDHVIYYDSKGNLENIGIKFIKEKQIAFPKAFGVFATPPKGWKE